MPSALHLTAKVLPGKRIEVTAPELPEEGTGELVIYLLDSTEGLVPFSRYPEALNVEYNVLIQSQQQRALAPEESARLEAIRTEIDALDAASEAGTAMQRPMALLREQLAALRRDVERLPDSSEITPPTP